MAIKPEKTTFTSGWFPLDCSREICGDCYADVAARFILPINKLRKKNQTVWIEKVNLVVDGDRARLEAEVLQ